MARIAFFSDLMSTLFERRPALPRSASKRPLSELCTALLSQQGEVSGVRLAADILSRYRAMSAAARREFFDYLAQSLDLDPEAVAKAARRYAQSRSPADLARLSREAEPQRQELFRRLNQAPGATETLVRMRLDLLGLLPEAPGLGVIDSDFRHLFASWFNRGFLVLRHIDWRTPANILEKIIEYEAVHAINDWDDLQRRLRPEDRRCFAFFHPAMPEEPLIFVEVALCKGIPGSVQALLARDRKTETEFDTAVFYSISNCQEGLRGISFGNSLIKQVVEELHRDLPQVSRFVTLSPVPGLGRWLGEAAAEHPAAAALLAADTAEGIAPLAEDLRRLCAQYLLGAKRADGLPADPVARFHLSNGAILHEIHAMADVSANGIRQSRTAMVNYLYDPARVEQNNENFVTAQKVAASKQVQALNGPRNTTGRKP